MATTVIFHYGKNRSSKSRPSDKTPAKAHASTPTAAQAQPQPRTQPVAVQQPQPKTQPVAIQQPQPQQAAAPAQDQYRTIVRPRFIGDSFVYVPVRVPTVNPDGSPIKSPGQAISDWWYGKKS